ncbi:tyrosine-type recombinase/integrase [Allosphingosinicella humi]
MHHFVEYDPVLAIAPVLLDGEQLLPGLQDLPDEIWFGKPLPSADQRVAGSRPPERGRTYTLLADGATNTVINQFVSFLRSDGVSKLTAQHYLYDLRKFERWLAIFGKNLIEASTDDTRDYRSLCLEGDITYRLSRSAWSRSEVALFRFYDWAVHEAGIITIAPRCKFRRKGALREQTVRMVSLEDYILFRNVGLLGLTSNTVEDDRSGSHTPLRDAAYNEFGITTGLRQQERTSLLLCELPLVDGFAFGGRKFTMLDVPETITKFQKHRRVPLPKRVLTEFVEPYLREERSLLVERWRRSGGALQPDNILGWLDENGRVVIAASPQSPKLPALLTIDERRRLVLLPDKNSPLAAASPAALWLNQRGNPMAPEAWASVFRRTCKRLKQRFGIQLHITDHMLRHSFAVHWLSRLIKIQLEADSEAWSLVSRNTTSQIYKKVVGDPLRQIQLWLGHASSLTTQKYLTYVDEAIEHIERGTELFDAVLGQVPAN